MKAYNPEKKRFLCRLGFHKWEERGTGYDYPFAWAQYCIRCGGVKDKNHPHAK